MSRYQIGPRHWLRWLNRHRKLTFVAASLLDLWLGRDKLRRDWAQFCRRVAVAGLQREEYLSLPTVLALLTYGKWVARNGDDEMLHDFYELLQRRRTT